MVRLWLRSALWQCAGWPWFYFSGANCIPKQDLRSSAFWSFLSPFADDAICVLLARFCFCSFAVIGQHAFASSSMPVLIRVCFRAFFALVQMAVSHCAVFVKIEKRFHLTALKACFHVEPHMMRTQK
jgi:hypothetical protein